jgi:FkbM family methyltransferase
MEDQKHLPTLAELLPTDEAVIYPPISYGIPYDNHYHDLYNDIFYRDIVFKDKPAGYYVEIGALDGVLYSQSFIFEKVLNWEGIIVEPNSFWKESLANNRKCNVSHNAVSNINGTAKFECRENHGFSGLTATTSKARHSDIVEEIEVDTVTLCTLLDTYKAPEIINWVAIDTEGAEIDILNQYFSENTKYRINLINVETYDYPAILDIFSSQPYVRIKNPYLDFIKISDNGMIKMNPFTGQLYRFPFINQIYTDINYIDIDFEQYYIHLDYLKENLHLKKFLI